MIESTVDKLEQQAKAAKEAEELAAKKLTSDKTSSDSLSSQPTPEGEAAKENIEAIEKAKGIGTEDGMNAFLDGATAADAGAAGTGMVGQAQQLGTAPSPYVQGNLDDPDKIILNGTQLKFYADQPAWAKAVFDQYKTILPELLASVPGGYESLNYSDATTNTQHPTKKHRDLYVNSLKAALGIYSDQPKAAEYGVQGFDVGVQINEIKDIYNNYNAKGQYVSD